MNRRTLFRLALGTAGLIATPAPLRKFFIIGQPERRWYTHVITPQDMLRGLFMVTDVVVSSEGWLKYEAMRVFTPPHAFAVGVNISPMLSPGDVVSLPLARHEQQSPRLGTRYMGMHSWR